MDTTTEATESTTESAEEPREVVTTRYHHTVVGGCVVSTPIDAVRYTGDGRIIATSPK